MALGLLVVILVAMVLRRSFTTTTGLTRAALACRHLQEAAAGLVLLEDDAPDAFAVPGPRGRIVITTGMLKALTPRERRALLAHERAHLAHHHQLYIQAADLAAAANPFLRPTARQVRRLVERWADEQAARAVGDRRLAARALARAALARSTSRRRGPAPPLAMPAVTGEVVERTLALRQPAIGPRPRLTAVVVGLGITSVLASLWIAHSTETRFEYAHASYGTGSVAAHVLAHER